MEMSQIIAGYFKSQPVDKAWLFGSYSRGEATHESDVDILVRFVPESRINLFKHARMMVDLQELLKKKVDLIEEGQVIDFAVESIDRDKHLIYERTLER